MENENKSNRGGKRKGAGRPFGTKKPPTVMFARRVSPKEKEALEKFLKELRGIN